MERQDTMAEAVLETASAAATRRAGRRLGQVLQAGDVVSLTGALGAGKTCFAEGLARGLGVPASHRVASPTFAIIHEHPGRLALFHVDLYRLSDAEELREIGLGDYFERGGVTVVEWFERFPELQPADRLDLTLEATGARTRRIRALARGPRAAARLKAWLG